MPDFDPETFRADAARFLAESVAADVHCPAFGAIMPPDLHDRARAWQRRMFDAGFAGLHWPAEHGGGGLGRDATSIWTEECARVDVQPYLNLQGIVLAGEAILRSGTPTQQDRFLRPTLTGEILWCQLFSEPDAGSDLASLSSTARRDGDDYVVSGQKVWCSNGQFAEYGILLARTDPERPGHRGISFFLLDMRSAGVDVRPLTQMTGDQEFCEVFLDEVRVPADALLGDEHGGWAVAMSVLLDERGSVGAAGVIGLERRLRSLTAPSSADRSGTESDGLARLLVRGHALAALLQRAGSDPAAASASKLLRTELEFDIEESEATARGAAGMLAGSDTDRFLYAPGMKIAGGTSEIQRDIIGERILGLPRSPR